MKSLLDYAPFVRDRREIARTFVRKLLGPEMVEELPFHRGQVQDAVDRFHPSRLQVTVAAARPVSSSAKLFTLVPRRGAFPPFHAGQYVNVFVDVQGTRTSRPYSLCSPPTRLGSVDIVVKRKSPGYVSSFLLDDVRPGDVLTVSGPAGDFHHNPLRDGDDLVLIAGGSGLAPLIGIMQDLVERGALVDALLLFGSRTEADIIFRGRLERMVRDHERMRVVHVLMEPDDSWGGERGVIDRALLLRHVPEQELARKTFFVCGPAPMYTRVLADLQELGVPERRIRLEAYGPPDNVVAHPGWPAAVNVNRRLFVRVDGRAEPVQVRAGEPLMCSLERAGITIPALCRAGSCGSCRTRLLEGDVFIPEGVGLRASDRAARYVHPCMAYPISDLRVRL